MGFVEVQFPPDISYGSSGGPAYATDVVIAESGYEQRNVNWQEARARYNVAHGVKNKAQLDNLIAFFRARKGRAYGFRFKDWTDYQAKNQYLGTGDGVQTIFQLRKNYQSGGVTEGRIIRKPVQGSVIIYGDGVRVNEGYLLDYSSGALSFAAAPAAGVSISADFEFDVPVRFDVDRLSATLDAYGVHSWQDILLIEVRV